MLDEPGFLAEIKALGNVQHDDIVPFHGFCHPFMLVYELAEGDLHHRLYSPMPPPWRERARTAKNIASALVYSHGLQPRVSHRDIKPDNILMLSGKAVLGDFGMAVVSEYPTLRSNVVGAVGFPCPRFRESGVLDESAEVFSYGMVLLELLAIGKTAAHGPSQTFLVAKNQIQG